MTNLVQTEQECATQAFINRAADWMRPFHDSFLWKGLFAFMLTFDSFIAAPQLYRVLTSSEIAGLSLETFTLAATASFIIIFYGVEKRDFWVSLGSLISFSLNTLVLFIALGRGVSYF